MVQTAPQLTVAGRSLLIRAIAGEQIEFTRFKVGNGTAPADPSALTDLVNPCVSYTFHQATIGDGYATLEGSFDSTNVSSAFRCKELGLFARGEDNTELLYAYANDGDSAGWIKPNESDVVSEYKTAVVVAIGDAEHVTAIIADSQLYASKEAFDDHVEADNPHGITKTKVGLGNVPNVATNDQTPTYSEAAAASALTSGEKLSAAFSKIAAAVHAIIDHIANRSNPHGISPSQIGAAPQQHEHNTADITQGKLGIERGGTGANSLAGLRLLTRFISQYDGTGQYGQDHKNRRTAKTGSPIELIIIGEYGSSREPQIFMRGINSASSKVDGTTLTFEWDRDGSVAWYGSSAVAQYNKSGSTYFIIEVY